MHRAIALLAAAACLSPAAGQTLDVQTHTLDNGLKILIHQDRDIPNVALYLFFRVGSRNEGPGTTGISHFFEHMMFNGTKRFGPKEFDIRMERAGGSNNAYTARDVTVYTDWFPRPALELMMDMEADRMQNLLFDPKIIESERGVVYSERRSRVDDDNFGTLYEQLNAVSFTAHPYAWPVMGWASDIEGWTMDDLKNHYRIGYAPNNCVMVVTGDVDPAEVLGLAKKYFGPIPRQEPPPPVRTREPQQPGERRALVRRAAQLPLLMASYHVPETASPESPALAVLNQILSEGRSSRLYRRLVDGEQLALSAQVFTDFSLDPSQFIVYVEPRSGAALDRVEAVLYEELERAAQEGVRPEEVQKAKNQILADLYRGFKTIAGKANLLGRYEVFHGDYRKLFTAAADLEKVTPEQVADVARKYLDPRNRTVAVLIPETQPAAESAPAEPAGESTPAAEVQQ